MNEKIVERIKKLLALTESSNENEARVAMLRAQELLAKHKLSLQEVEQVDLQPINIIEYKTDIQFSRAKWKSSLASTIAENLGCYTYNNRTSRIRTICFFGKDEDVTVCNAVLDYAINYIDSQVKKYKNQYRRESRSVVGLENTYAYGFLKGLREAFEVQKQEHAEWGLVLTRDEKVTQAHNNIEFAKKRPSKPVTRNNDEAIYNQAIEDGKKFSISDKVASEDRMMI